MAKRLFVALLVMMVLGVIAVRPSSAVTSTAPAKSRVYGLTLDDISNVSKIVPALAALPKKPTVRVVFDESQPPSYYVLALKQLHQHAYVMGEVLDSQFVSQVSTAQYQVRTKQYVDALAGFVDVWEIGNEVNGEWLGVTPQVVAKVSAAYDIVKSRGLKAALTLYYNPNCWEQADHEMLKWTKANIPPKMKAGLDQVLISYYEGDCNNYRPANWNPLFNNLRVMFPKSALGFGEVGMAKPVTNATVANGKSLMTYYYSLKISTPNYIGGYFWWNGAEDVVPASRPLYPTFKAVVAKY